MQPRYEDERVGYFNNSITEFSDEQQTTKHESIVMRYRLEPKDPEAYKAGKLVEPKKQIVYYIDPATPQKWVKYLIAGINDWNVAFEAAGFKNAIVGKEWPKNDSTMSVDDARFSMIRYLPSETENAYGPRIVDPRSGEIIEAHVCWYHNVMNLLKKWYMVQCGPLDKRAQKMDFDDELMGQLIRFVSSHEVGHTLGLRHNMIASQATPVEKLRDKAWVEKHGHTASIMDYARFNYVAQPEDNISEKGLFPRINDYDKWAIKWGYQYRPEFTDPDAEKKALRAEVSKVLKKDRRLWWCGDEGYGQDPRSQTEDLGDNQMKANEYGMKNLKRVMQNIEKWTAQPDGEYDHLQEIHNAVARQYQRYVNHVQRYIFGKYVNNAPGQKPYDFVPRELVEEALQWIDRNVMEAPMWLYPESIVTKQRLPDVGHPYARLGEPQERYERQERTAGNGAEGKEAGHGPDGGLPLRRLMGRPRQAAHSRRLAGTQLQADEAGLEGTHHRRADTAEAERRHTALGAGGQRDGQRPAVAHGTHQEEPQAVCGLHPRRLRRREGGIPRGHRHRPPGSWP